MQLSTMRFAALTAVVGMGIVIAGGACGSDDPSGTGGTGAAGAGGPGGQGGTGAAGAGGPGGQGGSGGSGGSGGFGGTGGAGGVGGVGGLGGAGGAGGAGGGSPLCFLGGNPVTPTGNGTCASPYIIDMQGLAMGSVVYHDAGTAGADETTQIGYGGCQLTTLFDNTQRDLVYQVLVPSLTNLLDVSVDAQAGADPRVGLFEDVSCGQPVNDCADDGGVGQCDALRGDSMQGEWFGTGPYVIVSELQDSGQPLTIRFRIDGP